VAEDLYSVATVPDRGGYAGEPERRALKPLVDRIQGSCFHQRLTRSSRARSRRKVMGDELSHLVYRVSYLTYEVRRDEARAARKLRQRFESKNFRNLQGT
jgi:hypothetical protein